MASRPSKEIRDHWDRVASLGCIITGRPEPTLHHCHSGSIAELGIYRGISQKPNDYLVIPLMWELHTGNYGIDSGMGVFTWEKRFGRQVDFLDQVSVLLNVNVWRKSGVQRDIIDVISDDDLYTWTQ